MIVCVRVCVCVCVPAYDLIIFWNFILNVNIFTIDYK